MSSSEARMNLTLTTLCLLFLLGTVAAFDGGLSVMVTLTAAALGYFASVCQSYVQPLRPQVTSPEPTRDQAEDADNVDRMRRDLGWS